MPTINGKRVLATDVPRNAGGGIDKVSNREALGEVAQGSVGTGRTLVQPTTSLPELTGQDLVDPPKPVDLSGTFQEVPVPDGTKAFGYADYMTERDKANEAAQKEMQEQQSLYNVLGADPNYSQNMQSSLLTEYGVTPEVLERRREIKTQLAKMNERSLRTQQEIAAAPGQTLRQGHGEITQQDRENYIRSYGLAAEAAVLDENIDTARDLVRDMMTQVNADRQVQLDMRKDQLDRAREVADKEQERAIEAELAVIAEEKEKIKRTEDAIDEAIASGAASREDIAIFQNQDLTDEEKFNRAQEVIGRVAKEDRDLDRANIWSQIRARDDDGFNFNSSIGDVEVPSFEEWAAENGGRVWELGGTEEQMNVLRQEYEDETSVIRQASIVDSLSPAAQAVVRDPRILEKTTPTEAGPLLTEIAAAGIDTRPITEGRKKVLPATQVESLNQASSVKEDVEKLYSMLQALPGTGPIAGRLSKLDKWDAKRQAIESQITRIVPGLARGIFGEVGVLTNEDVDRYTKTIANPEMTDAQIELEHQNTLDKIDQSINQAIQGFSWSGYNVERWEEELLISEPEEGGTDDDPLGINQ